MIRCNSGADGAVQTAYLRNANQAQGVIVQMKEDKVYSMPEDFVSGFLFINPRNNGYAHVQYHTPDS
jgi:hypothetical protein